MARILYEFVSQGAAGVRSDFKGIGDDARATDKAADEAMRKMRTRSKETARESTRSADHQRRLAESVAKDQQKSAAYIAGVKDRYFREEQRKEEQAERTAQRVAARAEAQKQRAVAVATTNRRKEIAKEITDRQTHEGRLQRIAQQATEKRAEGERRHQKKLADLRERADKARSSVIFDKGLADAQQRRKFDAELTAKQRVYELDKKRKQLLEKERDSLKGDIRGGIKGAVIGGAVATSALAAGITGAAARDALRLQEVSNRISISARGAGETAVDPNVLRKEFEQTAIRTPGVKSADVADAVAQFVSKTGNLDVARKSQGVFATVASATGSQVQDVAAAAADLFQKFDVNTVEGMADAMSALAFQGKAGAFELKDAASQFAKLSAAASRFGIAKGAEGVRVLGGLTQIARTATGSPEQAATAVEAMFRQFTSKEAQKQLRSIGVNAFKDKKQTQTRDIRALIVETISKSGGNLTKLQGIFGDEGIRAISPIISAFNEAEKSKKGTGSAAASAYIGGMVNAPGDYAELKKDAAQAQQDASARLTAAWENLTAKLADSTLPALGRLVDTLENSPGVIEGFVGAIEKVIDAFGWLIKGVDAWGDLLDDGKINLSNKKKKTAEETRDEERKKAELLKGQLERFDKKRGGSWDEASALRRAGKTKEADAMAARLQSTAYMDDERQTIAAQLEVAKKNVGQANGQILTAADQKKNIRSSAAFAEEYAKMLGPEEYKGQNQGRAEMIGKVLRDATLRDTEYTRTGALEGESEEARQFRVNQLTARREDLKNAGVTSQGETGAMTADKGGLAGIVEAAAKLVAAAGKIDSAAGKLGATTNPSIVGPGG